MAQGGVPGQGVTPLVGGVPVSNTNPLPVTAGGVAPPPWGVAVEQVFQASLTANGDTLIVAGVAGQTIYVTSYIFALTNAADVFFRQDPAGAQVSVKGFGVLSGNEVCGSQDQYLFALAPGVGLDINVSAGLAVGTPGSVQVRVRIA